MNEFGFVSSIWKHYICGQKEALCDYTTSELTHMLQSRETLLEH